MATKDADGGNAATTRSAEKPSSQNTQVDKRLEPLEEFRSRAEGWMKEVTAQVARLASSFETEDKKRQALENRLSDIEERIRSLLTLTELVSLDKNPFAGSPSPPASGSPQPQGAPGRTSDSPSTPDPTPTPTSTPTPSSTSTSTSTSTPTPDPASAADQAPGTGSSPEPVPLAADEEDEDEDPEPEVHPPVPAADRPGVEVIPVSSDPLGLEEEEPLPGPTTQPETGQATETEPEAEPEAGPEPEEEPLAGGETDPTSSGHSQQTEPETNRPWSLPAAEKDPVAGPAQGHHPNDAQAETSPPAPTEPPKHPSKGPAVEQKTAKRLLVVAWADLLAPASGKIDVDRFTGFYVEAGWVDEEAARLVGRLVEEIAPHVKPVKKCDMRALHEATVRLLAEHDPDLATFDRVDLDPDEGPDARKAKLNAT